jgi:ubiquinone/menaquinone biosynthesis C-methylase UbiE
MRQRAAVFDEALAVNYEAWYDTPAGKRADALEKAALQRLLRRFPDARTVLEVGAGTGHFTRWLGSEGLTVAGLDLSAAMLRQAQELDGVPWIRGHACQLPFDQGAFDLVAFITTLEFLPCPRRALSEGLRVARQGLLLGVLNRWSPLGMQRRLEAFFRPTLYREAHFYSVRELKRRLSPLTNNHVRFVWETTLVPDWWPRWLPTGPWGGFIAMTARPR